MKKLFTLLTAIVLTVSLAQANNEYKINDAVIDNLFANAEEIQVSSILFTNPLGLAGNTATLADGEKSRVTAGILALLLGGCGVHRFYLGHTKAGVLYIVLTVCTTLGYVVGWVDGIMYLIATDEEFKNKYAGNEKFLQWIGGK